MVLLQKNVSRKKSDTTTGSNVGHRSPLAEPKKGALDVDKMLAMLADAGCTLCVSRSSPIPFILNDPYRFQRRLESLFASEADALPAFIAGFSSYIQDHVNLTRVLTKYEGETSTCPDSLTRILLLIPPLQLPLQNLLLEKLPEFFDSGQGHLKGDFARIIVNHFRWLDFLVDPRTFLEKLLEVLSICPVQLKKEIIGSLPEIIGDQNHDEVISSLEQMLQEDSELIVPILDSFSNLNLDDQMQEQVVTIALSCIRTASMDHLPYLLRFLLLLATPANIKRIISQIREHVKLEGPTDSCASRNRHKKLKGKTSEANAETLIFEALRSSLRFKNVLCESVLKELKLIDKARDHKVLDVWLLILIFTNGGSLQKSAENIIKKKIVGGSLGETLFAQCIHGNKELAQDCFCAFISIAEFLLACKEQNAREFGISIYTTLFEEFLDSYSRKEILGSLVMHVGSGRNFEVNSALETLILLSSKYSQELISASSHINGILDYLEGFSDDNLHKVYELFSHLALSARSSANLEGSSIANELLMIVRKQIGNPDWRYKRMGIIGTLKVVSSLGDINAFPCIPTSQKANDEEALDLLRITLDSCKASPLFLVLFYDELIGLLDCTQLQPTIVEWMCQLVGEFESAFLYDLEEGQLSSTIGHTVGLEGELWMNLDGDLSPVCLNILSLLASSQEKSATLQFLPANFLLLSVVERLTNQGSLGGIDALLGCPLYLPSAKYFSGALWKSLSAKQMQLICLSLYYAINWLRELLNAFSTQISSKEDGIIQSTREETKVKLLMRLRNLVFLESLLNMCLARNPFSLPDVNCPMEDLRSCFYNDFEGSHSRRLNTNKRMVTGGTLQQRKRQKKSSDSPVPDLHGKLRQPTILETYKRADITISQQVLKDCLSVSEKEDMTEKDPQRHMLDMIRLSIESKFLDEQSHNFRPLLMDSLAILSLSEVKEEDPCCLDSAAELPLHLYLLHDLQSKLLCLSPPCKQLVTTGTDTRKDLYGLKKMSVTGFLNKVQPLIPSLRKHLDVAICLLEGSDICQRHWENKSIAAGNPRLSQVPMSKASVALSTSKEVLCCYNKMLSIPDIYLPLNNSVLKDLLDKFQSTSRIEDIVSGIQPSPLDGNMDYSFCAAFSFFDSVMDKARSSSFTLASEVLVTLQSIVNSVQTFIDKQPEGNRKKIGILPSLRKRLGILARGLLAYDWDSHGCDNNWRSKGDVLQKILHIYFSSSDSVHDLLSELACTLLPQVPSFKASSGQDSVSDLPTLCAATIVTWYRELHEENIRVLNELLKEVSLLQKSKVSNGKGIIEAMLGKMQRSVAIVVSLVNICRSHDKVSMHAMAVKYGGKFVDSFIKAFSFLQVHFQQHDEIIIQMVKELQKATRTIQTICSEAKVLKRTLITSKIPCTKRSMERFLFNVKSLLHSTSNGCSFWMGNLKHKDLTGQVVSSQAYHEDKEEGENPNQMQLEVQDISGSQGPEEP